MEKILHVKTPYIGKSLFSYKAIKLTKSNYRNGNFVVCSDCNILVDHACRMFLSEKKRQEKPTNMT